MVQAFSEDLVLVLHPTIQQHHAIDFLIIFICKVIHPLRRGAPQACSIPFGKTYMCFNIQELFVTLIFLKWITKKDLLYSTRTSNQYSVMTYRGLEPTEE